MTSEQFIIEAIRMYKGGKSISDICEKLTVERQTLYQWLRKAGIKTRTKGYDWDLIISKIK